MKHFILILFISLFSSTILFAQKIKKEQSFVKSDNPLEINPMQEFEINSDIDSTLISKEAYQKIKIVEVLIEEEKNKEALDIMNSIHEKDFEKNELFLLKGILELKLDDLANSSNSFTRYLSATANDSIKSAIYYTLGIIDMKRELKISATHNFKKSLELDTTNYSTAAILGTIHSNNKDLEKALFYYTKAVEINPGLNNIWNNLGFIYQQKGNHQEAEKIFSKIIKDEPESPLPYNNRGYSKLQLGLPKEAMKDVNQSIKLWPENSYAFRNRALIYITLNELENACKDIETALQLGFTEKYGDEVSLLKQKHCKK